MGCEDMFKFLIYWLLINFGLLGFLYLRSKALERVSRMDRRLGQDRRQFCYSASIPERRSGNDRRLRFAEQG